MAAFDIAIQTVLDNEGGYSDDPVDPGGETKFGISKRSFPSLDIKNLSRTDAARIYQDQFWNNHPNLARLASDRVATKIFDLMVNMGPRTAVKLFQRSINLVSHGHNPLPVDGLLGPMTVSRANVVDEQKLLHAMREAAADHYRAIVRAKPAQARFLRGWLRRAYQ